MSSILRSDVNVVVEAIKSAYTVEGGLLTAAHDGQDVGFSIDLLMGRVQGLRYVGDAVNSTLCHNGKISRSAVNKLVRTWKTVQTYERDAADMLVDEAQADNRRGRAQALDFAVAKLESLLR